MLGRQVQVSIICWRLARRKEKWAKDNHLPEKAQRPLSQAGSLSDPLHEMLSFAFWREACQTSLWQVLAYYETDTTGWTT